MKANKLKVLLLGAYFFTQLVFAANPILYFDEEGVLIWFNSRLMHDKKGSLKYMKAESDGVIKQDDILFMTSWTGKKIYLVEGEFDALSLKQVQFVTVQYGVTPKNNSNNNTQKRGTQQGTGASAGQTESVIASITGWGK